MRKRRLYWIFQICGWVTYLIINNLTLFVLLNDGSTEFPTLEVVDILVHTTILFLFTHLFLRTLIIRQNWLQVNLVKVIPKLLLSILLGIIVTVLVSIAIISSFTEISLQSSDGIREYLILPGLAYMVLLVTWSSIYFLYHYLESNNRSLKYEAAMNEMHLNQLKSQLNPHFIFNALNSMRALVDEEPKKAKTAITQLSNILRKSLITDKERVVAFRDELNTVKDYLALEGIRFEERLRVEFDIARGSEYFEVPPMMLQTLTENAIKHGVSNLMEGGLIQISTEIQESLLIVKIRNSGKLLNGVNRPKSQTGVGLVNTKERLKLIYGDGATFRMYNENDKFVVAEVKIPQRI